MEKENKSKKQLLEEIDELRLRLEESEETLNAIRSGEVDAIVVSGPQGDQVFTLTGAEQAYRVLIKTMNEGAASLNQEGTIIYCNQHLSEMIKTPLEKVIGTPMRQFIRASDLPVFDSLIVKGLQKSGKGEVTFIKNDGTVLPVLLSISALQRDNANMCGIIVTDLTAQKHIEEELRRHRDNLEELVKDRTSELETSNQQLREEITERKKAEKGLRASETHIQCILESTADGILAVDSHGKVIKGNRRFGNLWRIPQALLDTGNDKALLNFVLEQLADPEEFLKKVQLLYGTDKVDMDTLVFKDGRIFERYSTPLMIAGSVMGRVWSFRDITERKRAHDALRISEERFRQIAESAEEWIWEVNRDGLYIYASHVVEKILGYTPDEVVGEKYFYDFFPSDKREQMKKEVFEGFAGKRAFTKYVNMNAHKNGSIIILETSGLPILDSSGDLLGYRGVDVDITERKQAEIDLQAALIKVHDEKMRSEAIIASMGEGLSIQNTDFVITYENKIQKDIIGDHIGEHCYKAYENKDHVCEGCPVALSYRDGDIHKTERAVTTGKGALYVEITASPLRDIKGNIVAGIEVIRDITDQKKLEDQLRHAQKMEAVGTLAGGIAHDFNNILNVIMGYGNMVMDRMEADSLSKEQMNEVLIAAERAATLTKRLLVFSRKQVVEVKPVNINELILSLQKMLVRIIKESIDFNLELADSPLMVLADAGQIEQVLMNLASNAKDAMPEGGRLTIGTGIQEITDEYAAAYGCGKPGMYALITVADTGQGMDEETKKKIFEPFFTTKGIGEGTGLGLAISYGIIKQHNGYIKVYSETGKGTVFKIYLPLSEEATFPDKKTEAAVPAKGGNETILVAEDDASLRELARIILESFGYSVILAEDGEDAITKFTENRENISLVLLDMIMPKKSGKEACEAIRKISPRTKILFLSGYTMDIIMTKELTEGGFNFIHKPMSPQNLLKKVREVLDR